jgi:hypothetical protein
MKEIQKYLTSDERVEVYNTGITLYNLESADEDEFVDEEELIEFLKNR